MIESTSSGSESDDDGSAVGVVTDELRRLIAAHYRDVFRYAYRLSGSQADAEDLTQQTFLVAQLKLHQVREPEKANRWLFAVLRSCFLKSVGRPRTLLMDPLDLHVEDVDESRRESQTIDQEALHSALQELSEEYRLAVLMFYFDELSYKEIAEQLGIPIGTVMSRLARAKSRLRERLSRESADRKPSSAARPKERASSR